MIPADRAVLPPQPRHTAGGVARLPAGAIVLGDAGERYRVTPEGDVEELLPGGMPRPGCAHATARPRRGPVLGRRGAR